MTHWTDPGIYGTTKAEALRAHRDGRPALLPKANRWKSLVEDHRYGGHRSEGDDAPGAEPRCPACAASTQETDQ